MLIFCSCAILFTLTQMGGNMTGGDTGAQAETMYSIKQVADMFGNTRGAIRFYQEKGLVEPLLDDKGFRYYTLDDFFQLLHLKGFASMSLPLKDVAELFRRESDGRVVDIVGLVQARESDITEQMACLSRQLEALETYRGRLLDAQSGEVHFENVGAYWALDRDNVAAMFEEEPQTLTKLVGLMPATVIGGAYDFADSTAWHGVEIRISQRDALAAGLECSRFFRIILPTRLASMTVRLKADDLVRHIQDAALRLADNLRERGEVPSTLLFSSLLLVHREGGEDVEYHTLYMPLAG